MLFPNFDVTLIGGLYKLLKDIFYKYSSTLLIHLIHLFVLLPIGLSSNDYCDFIVYSEGHFYTECILHSMYFMRFLKHQCKWPLDLSIDFFPLKSYVNTFKYINMISVEQKEERGSLNS